MPPPYYIYIDSLKVLFIHLLYIYILYKEKYLHIHVNTKRNRSKKLQHFFKNRFPQKAVFSRFSAFFFFDI